MADKFLCTTAIAQQRGDYVLISVPLVGFPDGVELRKDTCVTLALDPSGKLIAKPLLDASRAVARWPDGRTEAYTLFATVGGKGPRNVIDIRPERP